MAKSERVQDGGAPGAPAVLALTVDQVQGIVDAAVSAAVGSVAPRSRLRGQALKDRMTDIKLKRGVYAKRPRTPDIPAPGHAIISDKFGRNPKMVELAGILRPKLLAGPFLGRTQPVDCGVYWHNVVNGDWKVKALAPYPPGVLPGRVHADQVHLLPFLGDAETGVPLISTMDEWNGAYFDPDYLKGLKAQRVLDKAG